MRIGILTFHRAYNCGAMLQAWALRKTLERMGHRAEFPACNHVGESGRWQYGWINPDKKGVVAKIRSVLGRFVVNACSIPNYDILRHRYRVFRRRHLPERRIAPADFASCYDILVVGSDQVFSIHHTSGEAALFLCESKPKTVPAIAYAASYGDSPLAGECLERLGRALANFKAVSVRESLAREQLSAFAERPVAETLDPTLLVSASDYDEIAGGEVPREPYLLLYALDTNAFFVETARALAARLGVRCVIAPCYAYSKLGAPEDFEFLVSPDRLVQYARQARYVLAGSFHGTVMGVVFGKPFLSLREQVDEHDSRPAALLRKLGCPERLVNPQVSIDEMERLLRLGAPDVEQKLESLREESLAWLRSQL